MAALVFHLPMVKVLFPTKKDVVVPKTFFIISLRKKIQFVCTKAWTFFVLFLAVVKVCGAG